MASPKLKEWADAVKARDGKCLDCGVLDDLHAHHVKPKATHPELTLVLENGRTLCYRCHKAEHERNRPVRMRATTPQRRTLLARIAELEEDLSAAITNCRELNAKAQRCKRGSCDSSLALMSKYGL